MRSEKEMYDLIVNVAKSDRRILACYMTGSRANLNAPKDIFQDYDIFYVVKDTLSFIQDKKWILQFGNIWYMQCPDQNPYYPHNPENIYSWLIQCKDGNRIDLHVESFKHAKQHILDKKMCKILWDPQQILPSISQSSDAYYHVKKPTQEQFLSTCTEFWWYLNNVAKGLYRKELPYANDMVNLYARKMLERIITWQIGIRTHFSVSVGKSCKYMKKWLTEKEYEIYLSTYVLDSVMHCWKSVFIMIDLFVTMAQDVAKKLSYRYDFEEEKAVIEYLKVVRQLPENATKI